ncbi:MAG: hypothetical protein KF729_17220 [Sandaracinaceae bacterium]|nr:hypothetical protein [Sandaracinaceae bacterium]
MVREAPEIRLIRETLEGVLHPSAASTVFFESLQAFGGALPTDAREAIDLVNGPLRRALVERLGDDGAAVADELATTLSAIGRSVRKRPSRHDEQTKAVSLSDETLPVYILTASKALVGLLHASVGPLVMSPLWVPDAAALRGRLSQIAPGFVLIDASDFPAIEPDELAQALCGLDAQLVKALWGADLPYGQGVMDAAHRLGFSLTPFDRREGVEPVLDVIRSRRA